MRIGHTFPRGISCGRARIVLLVALVLAPNVLGAQSPAYGTAVAWGDNSLSELGDPAAGSYSLDPVLVRGPGNVGILDGAVAVAAGSYHSVAVLADGSVYAWGSNSAGQLGNPSAGAFTATPVRVLGLDGVGTLGGVVAVSTSSDSNHALLADGSVVGWGRNDRGQLGDGTITESRSAPVRVRAVGGSGFLVGVAAVAEGESHSVAALTDGRVVAWGSNELGALGDGGTSDSTLPVFVKGQGGIGQLSGVKAVAAGQRFSLALMHDGAILAWGSNLVGNLGNPSVGVARGMSSAVPVPVMAPDGGPLSGAVAVAAGTSHSLAVLSDSTVVGWGKNVSDVLGGGAAGPISRLPAPILGVDGTGLLTGMTGVAAGTYCSIAFRSGGGIYTWGDPLVNGDGHSRETPAQVKGVDGRATLGGVIAAACGSNHALAVASITR